MWPGLEMECFAIGDSGELVTIGLGGIGWFCKQELQRERRGGEIAMFGGGTVAAAHVGGGADPAGRWGRVKESHGPLQVN